MAHITTSCGDIVTIDDSDLVWASQFSWHTTKDGYAGRSEPIGGGKYRRRLMHRELLGLGVGDQRIGDHANGNRLDNRRLNLRACSFSQNARNRSLGRDNKTGFKGVSFRREHGKYGAAIRYGKKMKHLGYFKDAALAHEFYCLAADLLHGEFANHGLKEQP